MNHKSEKYKMKYCNVLLRIFVCGFCLTLLCSCSYFNDNKEDKNFVQKRRIALAADCIERGNNFYAAQQYDLSTMEYSRALEFTPDNATAYYYRGWSRAYIKLYYEAIQDFSTTIELSPDDAAGYYSRGWVYSKLKDYDRAIRDCSKSIELNPNNVMAYYTRAVAYARLKQYDKAVQDYFKAIEVKPDYVIAYRNMLEVDLISNSLKQFGEVLKQFSAAVPDYRLSKEDFIVKLYLICIYKTLKNESPKETEMQLNEQLKEHVKLKWSFDLTDGWLNNPNNNLTPEQIYYIRTLTDRVKSTQSN